MSSFQRLIVKYTNVTFGTDESVLRCPYREVPLYIHVYIIYIHMYYIMYTCVCTLTDKRNSQLSLEELIHPFKLGLPVGHTHTHTHTHTQMFL